MLIVSGSADIPLHIIIAMVRVTRLIMHVIRWLLRKPASHYLTLTNLTRGLMADRDASKDASWGRTIPTFSKCLMKSVLWVQLGLDSRCLVDHTLDQNTAILLLIIVVYRANICTPCIVILFGSVWLWLSLRRDNFIIVWSNASSRLRLLCRALHIFYPFNNN